MLKYNTIDIYVAYICSKKSTVFERLAYWNKGDNAIYISKELSSEFQTQCLEFMRQLSFKLKVSRITQKK